MGRPIKLIKSILLSKGCTCAADQIFTLCHNSDMQSRVVNNFADCVQNNTECRSSEEMRAAFNDFNNQSSEIKQKCEIISMDVKALYPSMSWVEIIKSIKWLILKSDMKIMNVNWHEVGKYLAVVMTPQDITAEGLENVIPKRQGLRLRKITVELD